MNGWIKLHRKLLLNPISKNPTYSWLWILLLLKAHHKEDKIMWNGGVLIVKEGQIVTGRKQLSEDSGIPETTIERILKYLENGQQIEQQKTTKFRLITIVNWKEYQLTDNTLDNKRTTNGQQTDTVKNDNKDKKDKEGAEAPPFASLSLPVEETVELVDEDGNPIAGKKTKERKNAVALGLQRHFNDLAYKELGTRPIMDSKGYFVTIAALRNLSEAQIKDLFVEWFGLGKPDDEAISLTRALSNRQIEQYKIRNQIS
ncbi:MAG: hypothetical protein KGL39_46610 [Patescibacteria group bacterium]|nr:hypothetical protein [Patescibacteria group bacterium]